MKICTVSQIRTSTWDVFQFVLQHNESNNCSTGFRTCGCLSKPPVLSLWPIYWSGHPKKYLCSSSKNTLSWSDYPKICKDMSRCTYGANILLLEVIAAVIPIWCRTLTSDRLKSLDDDASTLFVNGPNINDICFCFLLSFLVVFFALIIVCACVFGYCFLLLFLLLLIVFCFVISYQSLFCYFVISFCLDFLNSLIRNTL